MVAYSLDLRTRVLKDSDAGMASKLVAEKYAVSRAWVDRLSQTAVYDTCWPATPASRAWGWWRLSAKASALARSRPSERDGRGHRDRPRRPEPRRVLGDGRQIRLVE